MAWARLVFGALTLGVIMLLTRSRLPREPIVWLHFLVVAVTYCVIPFLLFAWAEQYVSSSLASIYNAVTPITTAILATAAFRVERLNRDQVLGVLVGVIGVVVVVGPWSIAALSGAASPARSATRPSATTTRTAVSSGYRRTSNSVPTARTAALATCTTKG